VGTAEANALMTTIESTCKKLINSNFPLFIQVIPFFNATLAPFHIADKVKYIIQDCEHNPKRRIVFEFNMLSRRKITHQECKILDNIITSYFNNPFSILTPAEQHALLNINDTSSSSAIADTPLIQRTASTELSSLFSTSTPSSPAVKTSPYLLPMAIEARNKSPTSPENLDEDRGVRRKRFKGKAIPFDLGDND